MKYMNGYRKHGRKCIRINMLEVKEIIREDTDRFYKHSYSINQDGVYMVLTSNYPEIREALDLDTIETKSTKLKYYLTRELLSKLRTYGGNYYICKCKREIDITYLGGCFLIEVEGFPIKLYPYEDTDKVYKTIKKIWRLI